MPREWQDYGARFFANDAKPTGGWIEFPGSFKDSEAKKVFRESYQQAQSGVPRNLRDDLPGWVLDRLAAHGIESARLVLEITETSIAADPIRATVLLEELSAAGVKVSLDDFGQGYTSLGSLGHLPVSELKIDRGFVFAMQDSHEDRAIVASVIELGHQLGLTVVAEGVETEAVCATLRAMGCDTMQGYLFSPAVPASQALGLIENMHSTV